MFSVPDQTVDRKWESVIERALSSWETVVEWADYISFLSRLKRAVLFKAKPDSPLPRAPEISEYLSRCLEPSLPAGVHKTALEVYARVFQTIGSDAMYRSMNLWLPGILPVFSYAAFNVKPLLVDIIEKDVLPCPTLRELCRPLFAAILPSLDDESNECFDEMLDLIEKLRIRLNDPILFWQTMFLSVITSRESSLGFLTYCGRNLPVFKEKLSSEAKVATSPEPGTLLRALCNGLKDPNVLAQRGFLDLLVKNLPLNSEVFSRAVERDVQMLIFAACQTIKRKDMSLNRRLWSWLLGPEPDPSEPEQLSRVDFFKTFGLPHLLKVLLQRINSGRADQFEDACIVIHGLMDRWELASLVIPRVLEPVLRSDMKLNDASARQAASQLFDGIETAVIWKSAFELVSQGDVETVTFLAREFNLQDPEMLEIHIPNILLLVSEKLLTESDSDYETLASVLLGLLTASSVVAVTTNLGDKIDLEKKLNTYYEQAVSSASDDDNQTHQSQVPLSKEYFTSSLCYNLIEFYARQVAASNADEEDELEHSPKEVKKHSKLLMKFLKLFPAWTFKSTTLNKCLVEADIPDPDVFVVVVHTMEEQDKLSWMQKMAKYCFEKISSVGNSQVELIRDLWKVHEAYGGFCAPSAIAASFADPHNTGLDISKVFGALWIHSVDRADYAQLLAAPTFIFLDLLDSRQDKDVRAAAHVLSSSVVATKKADKMIRLLLEAIGAASGDHALMEYYMRLLHTLVTSEEQEVKKVFMEQFSEQTKDVFNKWLYSSDSSHSGPYYVGLVLILVMYEGTLNQKKNRELIDISMKLMAQSGRETINQRLLAFLARVLQRVKLDPNVTFGDEDSFQYSLYSFLEWNLQQVEDEVAMAGVSLLFSEFLKTYGSSIAQVVSALALSITQKLGNIADTDILSQDLDEVGENDIVNQLLHCLEKLLNAAFGAVFSHDAQKRQTKEGSLTPSIASSSSNASTLFGNVISGVFSVEPPGERSAYENSRVLLYEAVDITMRQCCDYWRNFEETRSRTLQSSEYSTALYVSGRLKTRLRRITSLIYKHMPAETIRLSVMYSNSRASAVRLTHLFENTRYKQTVEVIVEDLETWIGGKESKNGMPAYEHDPEHGEYMGFFLAYIDTLESDVMEDVWPALTSFFHEVNNRAGHYSGILLACMRLAQMMAIKIESTNFGSRKKVRKEFADIYTRLVSNTLTELSPEELLGAKETETSGLGYTIVDLMPDMNILTGEPERNSSAMSRILSTVVLPQLKSSDNLSQVSGKTFQLLALVVESSTTIKVWRSLVADLIFEFKILTLSEEQLTTLLPVISKWTQVDKERLSDFLGRIANYGSNTVLFNWSGGQEITNTNLLRLAIICISSDSFPINYQRLFNQLAIIWSDRLSIPFVCILLRALLIGRDRSQLSPVFLFLALKLQNLFRGFLASVGSPTVTDKELRDPANVMALLEASKTLDFLLTLDSEQFHLYEWLFILDSSDAIYPHDEDRSGDVIDKLAKKQALKRIDDGFSRVESSGAITTEGHRRPMLEGDIKLRDLHVFFNQASITWYETVYSLAPPDLAYMKELIIRDILQA